MAPSASFLAIIAAVAMSSVYLTSFLDKGFGSADIWSTNGNHPPHQQQQQQQNNHRELQESGDFVPMACNVDLEMAPCDRWSERFGTQSTIHKRVEIPCGECVVMDHLTTDVLTLTAGLDIYGKLVFEDGYSLTMFTPIITVQGELHMASTGPVDGTPLIRIVLTGEDDQFLQGIHENAMACNGQSSCNVGKKVIVVAGGLVDIRGIAPHTPTWLRLYDVAHKEGEDIQLPSVILLDRAVKDKWMNGAEIVITSHTRDWDQHQVRTIISVADYSDRLVQIELDQPIRRPTTVVESPDFAVEVALLSRNIVFEGGEDQRNLHGGHFWFMNTPGVIQSLIGVDFQNFGQQGILGRYPIHVHHCFDMSGSIVAKNTIRRSNQRCIVVHNTNNLLVEENVAFDTKGHCYIVEDGMETGNKFLRNLGAQTGAPTELIPDYGHNGRETDDDPATFWMTNPTNVWIGNVAAGSQGSGFWFELQLRGTHAHLHANHNPKTAPLIKFENNVAHSNNNRGMRTYPSGYVPDEVQTFRGIKSYRNEGAGVFLHISKNINIEGALVADNRNIGIDIDRADAIRVENSEVVGETLLYKDLVLTQDARLSCVEDAQYGIQLHTWKNDPVNSGVVIKNVSFTGFSDIQCVVGVPFHVDDTIKTGQFDSYTALSKVKFSDPRSAIDLCAAEKAGIVDVYLTDLDGSFRPADGVASEMSSTLLSNNEGMLKFVNRNNCNTNEERCYSYCTNTCFRSVRFEIDPANTADYKLKVCPKSEPTNCIFVHGKQRVDDGDAFSYEHRFFLAHLPVGGYNAVFLNGAGVETWPSFVHVHYEEATCPTSFPDGAVNLVQPPPHEDGCNNLIRNGDLERSTTEPMFWTYRLGGIQVVPGYGVGQSNAITGLDRDPSVTLSQYLDTRCLKQHTGRYFEVKAEIKLQSVSGEHYVCDVSKMPCPEIGFFTGDDFIPMADLDPKVNAAGFQTIQTFVRIDDHLAFAREPRFDIKSNVDGKIMLVDNVSMRLVADEARYCENVILKPTIEGELFWQVTGLGGLSIVDGPLDALDATAPKRQSLHISGRQSFDDGLYYTGWRPIETGCLQPGSLWQLSALLQLVDRGTGKGVSCTDPVVCPAIRVIIKDGNGNDVFLAKYDTFVQDANSFNLFQSEFKLPTRETWDGAIGNVIVDIRSFPVEYDLVMGSFVMARVG